MTAKDRLLATGGRPRVIGHRGVPCLHQENTLAGFRRALSLGLDGVELDARLTRDRRVVVLHDADLKRFGGPALPVAELTWDEVWRVRLPSRVLVGHDEDGRPIETTYPREEHVALLEEVLGEVGGSFLIDVELKPETEGGDEIAGRVAALVAAARLQDTVVATSFDPGKLAAWRRAAPDLPAGLIVDHRSLAAVAAWAARSADGEPLRGSPEELLAAVLALNRAHAWFPADAIALERQLVDRALVADFRAHGLAVGCYTALRLAAMSDPDPTLRRSEENELARLLDSALDWIVTDDGERLRARVG